MPPAWVGSCLNGPVQLVAQMGLPSTAGVFEAAELDQPQAAEIVRDDFGVPHIYAATMHDLFFLNGVAHAQDRLWQMHSGRMLAAGRLCEMVGAKALDIDKFARQLGFIVLAEEDLETLRSCTMPNSTGTLQMMQAYCNGVNWYAVKAADTKQLPLEFKLAKQQWEPWTIAHSLSMMRFWSFTMNFGFQHSLLRRALSELFDPVKASAWTCTSEDEDSMPCHVDSAAWKAFTQSGLLGTLGDVLRMPAGQGSNWWILHGSQTSTGMPILVGDPHLAIRVPNFWYEVHLELTDATDDICAAGTAPPGLPGILIGHNCYLATAITLSYCDVEDVFLERVRRSDGKYKHKEQWIDCEVRREVIKIKGAEAEVCNCRSTCHGPLIEGNGMQQHQSFQHVVANAEQVKLAGEGCADEDILIAYAAIALRPKSTSTMALYMLLRGKSYEEFDAALSHISATISLNFAYADIAGNIGYVMTGEVPCRGDPKRAQTRGVEQYPLAGWTGQHDWIGAVKHRDLPKCFNPPSGLVISANHKVVDYEFYPHYLGNCWKSGFRAQAIAEELKNILSAGKAEPQQMIAMLRNTKSWAAVEFLKELQHVVPSAENLEAYKMLMAWDCDVAADSVTSSLYQLTHAELVRILVMAGAKTLHDSSAGGIGDALLVEIIGGAAFDANHVLKFLNEFQGHVHLNVLRMLRSAREALTAEVPADMSSESAGRIWWIQQADGRDAAVNAALRRAVARLEEVGGRHWQHSRAVEWGQFHIANFCHPLTKGLGLPPGSKPFDCPSLPCPGDTNTIRQAATKGIVDLSANSSQQSLRIMYNLADLGDTATNQIIMPLGQSGICASKHYMDQSKLWHEGKMKPRLLRRADIMAAAQSTMHFARATPHSSTHQASALLRCVQGICGS
ncbi:acyII [Symbiodinium natans]|uniref:AcyII protein n=1 Tax=Symbiodinium natans TaxID=878477 RepID=A0A812HFH6_9DINO|nr:acyII [Symbiodinium natans]